MMHRYQRHLCLPEIGPEGQQRLLQSRILVIGAGGLGSAAAYYLAAAGVGTLGIADFDIVSTSNLQRQILHTTDRVGQLKTDSAKVALRALNSEINIVTHVRELTKISMKKIFPEYDLIVDGSDNFPTRYQTNDTCLLLKKPFVYGSAIGFKGQVTFFQPGTGPCYRCLYPKSPADGETPNCSTAGVLGAVPGIIGLLQALEAIKWILQKGEPLIGRLLLFDALACQFQEIKIQKDSQCIC